MARLSPKKVIKLVNEKRGNLSIVAKSLNISRTTLYKYIKDKPTIQEAIEEARETMIDNVESQLYLKALGGYEASMFFFLKTQAKHRGYTEKQELSFDKPIQFEITENLTDEQFKGALGNLAKISLEITGGFGLHETAGSTESDDPEG